MTKITKETEQKADREAFKQAYPHISDRLDNTVIDLKVLQWQIQSLQDRPYVDKPPSGWKPALRKLVIDFFVFTGALLFVNWLQK